jgi:hypothetical protein
LAFPSEGAVYAAPRQPANTLGLPAVSKAAIVRVEASQNFYKEWNISFSYQNAI